MLAPSLIRILVSWNRTNCPAFYRRMNAPCSFELVGRCVINCRKLMRLFRTYRLRPGTKDDGRRSGSGQAGHRAARLSLVSCDSGDRRRAARSGSSARSLGISEVNCQAVAEHTRGPGELDSSLRTASAGHDDEDDERQRERRARHRSLSVFPELIFKGWRVRDGEDNKIGERLFDRLPTLSDQVCY